MVDRTVKVTLSASVQAYQKGMQDAADATRKVGSEGEKLAQMREAYDGIGRGAIIMGGLIATGVGIAVSRFADFDAAMSNVQAATHESTENMGLLREAAIDAGSSTVFSATEAAGAIEELAKAGISTSDIMKGALTGSLDLAAAGELGVARAAEITSTALNQFGLDGSEASHVADVLAAGAGKAMGSVEDLANGLKFVGPVAASMGVSLEETTGVLALFAQQGIIGEQAGTSLRGVLSSLTAPSAQARGEIERLGLTLYDANGNFLGLQNAAGQLANAYTGMDDASRQASMGIIFGRETITAATALYQAGAGGVDEWTKAVDDSGFAAETARMRLDNLKGDLEALGGAMDAALIQTGSGANDTLRSVVQSLTGLAEMYGNLPAPVQSATLIIGASTAAVALAGGAAMLAVPKFIEFRAAVSGAGLSMSGMALKAGAASVALGGIMAVVGAYAQRQADMSSATQEFVTTLDDATGAVTENTRQMIAKKLADQGVFEQAEKAGYSQKELTDALYEGGDAAQAAIDAFTGASAATGGFDIGLSNARRAVDDMNTQIGDSRQKHEDYKAAVEGSTEVTAEGVPVTQSAADAYLEASSGAQDLADSLNQLIEAVMEANGIGQDAISQNIAYQEALASVDEAIAKAKEGQEGYALSLDVNTEAGRKNMGMLVDLASDSQSAADAQFKLDGNTAAYRATLEAGRQALIDRAQQLGMNSDEAGALADQIYRIPSETEWKVIADTASAGQTINRFITDNSGRQIPLRITATGIEQIRLPNGMTALSSANGNLVDYSKGIQKFANGGFATGIYTGRGAGIHKFAEQETGWEAYISGKPSQRDRNIAIWEATGNRLGVNGQQAVNVSVAAPVVTMPDRFTLMVNGQQMDAYVMGAAADVVRNAFSSDQGGAR
ncbi:phage tail tape measure protein [Microbacterium enclense]|uniref:phage tail tape measure protein n=1 Tax=Microbacterium enclense TaxID=993073 RepID=UPI0034215713